MNYLQLLPFRAALTVGSLLFLTLLTVGCRRDEIEIYDVPKEIPHAHGTSSSSETADRPLPRITWETPKGWTEQPAERMRVAHLAVSGSGGKSADVSIIPLPGVNVPRLEVINLWRQQVQLPPLESADAAKLGEPVAFGPHSGELFDMVSAEPLSESKSKIRILVAMVAAEGVMWFAKMTGDDELVTQEKSNFQQFLKSLHFQQAEEGGIGRPRMESTNTRRETAPPAASTAGHPEWKVPAGWAEQPATSMLLARFAIDAGAKGKAEATVSSFPGPAGGALGNINRWRGQIALAPVTEAELPRMTTALDQIGAGVILVDMTGKSVAGGGDRSTRIVAIMVPRSDRTWFYKLMGDDAVVAQEKDALVHFVESVRYPNAL